MILVGAAAGWLTLEKSSLLVIWQGAHDRMLTAEVRPEEVLFALTSVLVSSMVVLSIVFVVMRRRHRAPSFRSGTSPLGMIASEALVVGLGTTLVLWTHGILGPWWLWLVVWLAPVPMAWCVLALVEWWEPGSRWIACFGRALALGLVLTALLLFLTWG